MVLFMKLNLKTTTKICLILVVFLLSNQYSYSQVVYFKSAAQLSNLTREENRQHVKVNSYRLGWGATVGFEKEVFKGIGYDLSLRYINRKPIESFVLVGGRSAGAILFVGVVDNQPTHPSYKGFDPDLHNKTPNSQYLELHFQPSYSFEFQNLGKLKLKAGVFAAYLINQEQMNTSVEEFGPDIVRFVESFTQLIDPIGVEYSPGDLGIVGGVSYSYNFNHWGEFSLSTQFSRGFIRVQDNSGRFSNYDTARWLTFELGIGYSYPLGKSTR